MPMLVLGSSTVCGYNPSRCEQFSIRRVELHTLIAKGFYTFLECMHGNLSKGRSLDHPGIQGPQPIQPDLKPSL